MAKNIYDAKFIKETKSRTQNNNHSKNLYLVAKKGNLTTKGDLKKIYERTEKRHYLNSSDREKQYKLYNKSLKEIKSKYGAKEYNNIYNSL